MNGLGLVLLMKFGYAKGRFGLYILGALKNALGPGNRSCQRQIPKSLWINGLSVFGVC
jgi:hypothetical protein